MLAALGPGPTIGTGLSAPPAAGVASTSLFANNRGLPHGEQELGFVLDRVADALDDFHQRFGLWPASDGSGTWFDKLAGADPQLLEEVPWNLVGDQRSPIDAWGRRLVFDPPPVAETSLSGSPRSLRSIGANGVDEQGDGDDFCARRGYRWGVGSKSRFPLALVVLCVGAAAGVSALFLRRVRLRRRLLMPAGIFGASCAAATYLADPNWDTTATVLPSWLPCGVPCGILVVAAAVVAEATCCVVARLQPGSGRRCHECHHMRAPGAIRCPECGQDYGDPC